MGRMFQTIGVNPRYEIVPILQGLLNLLTRGQNLRINSELLRGYESPSIFMTKTIEEIKIEDLTLLDTNPRQVRTGAIQRLAKSLSGPRGRDLFVKRPCLVNKRDGKLIVYAGNQRLRAAQSLKWQTVPCIVDEISIEQEREETIKDNLVIGEWDTDILANTFDMKELEDWGMDLKDLGIDFGKEDETDEVPEPPKEARAERGKIYQLGKHRVMCGDSTNAGDVALLMDGKKADMVFTDPPYGMNYDPAMCDTVRPKGEWCNKPKNYSKVIGDDKDFDPSFLLEYFKSVKEIFLWGADYYKNKLPNDGSWIVWDKRFGLEDVKWTTSEFELCWSKEKHHRQIARIKWHGLCGMENDDTSERVHPTQKPALLVKWVLDKFKGDLLVDLFLGSGSTLIACQQTGRICYGMEIDPKYVDVIIERFCNYTGQDKEEIYGKAS